MKKINEFYILMLLGSFIAWYLLGTRQYPILSIPIVIVWVLEVVIYKNKKHG